jgi:hypothetical protein
MGGVITAFNEIKSWRNITIGGYRGRQHGLGGNGHHDREPPRPWHFVEQSDCETTYRSW